MKHFIHPFKQAKLYCGKGDWYVYYHYKHPHTGEWVMFKDRGGLNYRNLRSAPKERKKRGDTLRDAYNERLLSGWSPFGEQAAANSKYDTMKFQPAVKVLKELMQIKKSSIKLRTWHSYTYSLEKLIEYFKSRGWDTLLIEHIKEQHLTGMFDAMQSSGKFKNKSINNVAAHLRALFNVAVKRDLMAKNPLTGYQKLQVQSGKNFPFSPKQKTALKKTILKHDPDLWLFVKCIYHLFVRPLELLQVKLSHIDLRTGQIIIHSQIGKNKKQMGVEIPRSFIAELRQLKLHQYPEDYYLFGKDLKICGQPYHRNRVSERHTAMLRKCNITDPDYTMYGWKHTGNVDAYLAGVDVYDLMRQNRHHSLEQTMNYLRSMGLRPNVGYSKKAPKL